MHELLKKVTNTFYPRDDAYMNKKLQRGSIKARSCKQSTSERLIQFLLAKHFAEIMVYV